MDVDQFNRIAERVEPRLKRSIPPAELRQTRMYRAVVLSVHGIRSRGEWQSDINRPLTDAGFLHQPIDIGAIGLGSAWRPRTASRAAQQVADHYYRLRDRAPKVMAIGHSFGSLAIGKALQVNPTCRISRVILWGSVLRVSFPWTTLADNGQVSEVLNEACRRGLGLSCGLPFLCFARRWTLRSPGLRTGGRLPRIQEVPHLDESRSSRHRNVLRGHLGSVPPLRPPGALRC